MATERLTKGVFIHNTEVPVAQIRASEGLFGLERRATLSRGGILPRRSQSTLVLLTHPGQVIPSSEYTQSEPTSNLRYPQNTTLYEIAQTAPRGVKPPSNFLERQRGNKNGNKLKFLSLQECVAIIPRGEAKRALGVAETAITERINEPETTEALTIALKKTKVTAHSLGKSELAKMLTQLLIEQRVALTINYARRTIQIARGEGLTGSSPVPDHYSWAVPPEDATTVSRFISSLRSKLAGSRLSSPYLQRYRRLLVGELDRSLRELA